MAAAVVGVHNTGAAGSVFFSFYRLRFYFWSCCPDEYPVIEIVIFSTKFMLNFAGISRSLSVRFN